MTVPEVTKAKILTLIDVVGYIPNAIECKTLIKKPTGNILVMSSDTGCGLAKTSSPFDIFIHIIDGTVEVIIDAKSDLLEPGQGIVVPAHSWYQIQTSGRFKMISGIIKSGYEE